MLVQCTRPRTRNDSAYAQLFGLNDDDSRGDLQETCSPVGGNIRSSLRDSEVDANLRDDWGIGTCLQHN